MKLNDLMQKLCPNGVEYVNVGEVCEKKKRRAI